MSAGSRSLSVCMIVRNEAELLPDCLASLDGLADEVLVTDTGSTDDTVRIAAEHGASVSSHPWKDDFSEARNASIRHAKGDWILWVDADERINKADHDRIRRLIGDGRCDAYAVPIASETPGGRQITFGHRLFRNRRGFRFSGRIHEQVSPSIERAGGRIRRADFTIAHCGYNLAPERMEAKLRRNLDLLETARREDPADPYVRFTLAQALLKLKETVRAQEELEIALGERSDVRMRGSLPPDTRAAALNNLAQCALARGAPVTALERCRHSMKLAPRQTTAHMLACQAYKALGKDEEALAELESARKLISAGGIPDTAIETSADPSDIERQMGYCCLRLGRPDEAERHFRRAIQMGTRHRASTLAALTRCAIALNEPDRALDLAKQALDESPGDDSLLDLLAFVHLKRGQFNEAAECLGRLCLRRPDDIRLQKRLAGVLVRCGRPEEAARLLMKLQAREPVAETPGCPAGEAVSRDLINSGFPL